jgi:lipoprotein-anchoring transpeptidase ErfK/SrfK
VGLVERPSKVEADTPPSAKPAARDQVSAYRSARERGQPVAWLRRATALRSRPGGRVLARLKLRTEYRSRRVLAAVGERDGWLRVVASELPNSRRGWIPASAATVRPSQWRVRVDLSRRRVAVLRQERVVRRFTVAVGRPSTPTPTGRFAVTDRIEWVGGSSAYGCCALALSGHQPHIEPGWSGGDRLAIHGTAAQQSIGAAASFGCLRARERDTRWLVDHVQLGTIVEIRD